ncbi:polysaccharide biosynthesis protein [Rhodobacterales bacterium FZCC0188]|nr:polysaccharide biosynthesis protein [Rhodobacterales bacterium FZCC0188]
MAMALRLDGIFTQINPISWMTLFMVIPSTILIFGRLGLYRAIVRFMAEKAVASILVGAFLSAVIMFATNLFFTLGVPRSVPVIYFSLLVLTTGGTRMLMRTLHLAAKDVGRIPVVVYGAGETGRLLMRSLQESRNYRPSLFIDDNKRLQGTSISDIPVLPLETAKKTILDQGIKIALIAIGQNERKAQRQAASAMTSLGLEVRMAPKLSDLMSGRVKISALRKLRIEELLGRDVVEPDTNLMNRTIQGQSVMITGAGGSIGSELCHQIIRHSPRRIVLFELSEHALYKITEELRDTIKAHKYLVELVPVLGSVVQQEIIENVIAENAVEAIFHAAAYKHVPLVEENAIEGIRNNALGTYSTAQAAGRLGVHNFVLISTDKAVRPTNIMGATKRLAELAVLEAADTYPQTKFCSVRFGNVLGSSGSVVPKFEQQIKMGGPLTLTHPDITRYFMTVHEAAQLVIQASAMATRGDVFVLDMGDPIRIIDLARTMCSINGLMLHTDKTQEAPKGSISLEITGLRPGEKLYEELLVTGTELNTSHSRIKREQHTTNQIDEIGPVIDRLLQLRGNAALAEALAQLPLEYKMDQRYHARLNAS